MLKRLFRPTNRRARLLVGILLAGLFCVQCTRPGADPEFSLVTVIDGKAIGKNSPAVLQKVEDLAKTDHTALLEYCLEKYQGRYRDYTCTLVKQERIRGALTAEQWVDVKFMASPFSVAMKWTKNPPIGDRVVYVEGKYNNQMLVRPGGLLGKLVGTVLRKPDGPEAQRNTLRPVNLFGFERGMESLIQVYRQAERAGDLQETFGGYAAVDGRQTIALVRHLPPKDDYPAYETRVYIDLEYLVPILIEGIDWDNELSCRYLYRNIRFNVGLRDEDFRPEANDMKPPK